MNYTNNFECNTSKSVRTMSKANVKKISTVQINDKQLEIHEINYGSRYSTTGKGPKIGKRHFQAILMMFGLIFAIGMRTSFSVAIVAMTGSKNESPNPNIPTYDWKNTSVILSSFFWSYISLQLLAGYLGKTYGHKYFLLCGYFFNCCAFACIPIAAKNLGWKGAIMCRVFQGFGQSFLYPSVNVLLGKWAPFEERATLGNIIASGGSIGTILGSVLAGYIAKTSWGWPGSFYILSVLGGLWCIVWAIFAQNSPASDPTITNEEKKYIQASLQQEDNLNLPVPWKKIFTCIPFYAVLVCSFSNIWCYAMMMTEIPTYLSKAMHYDVESSGVISSVPTALSLICGLLIGLFSDWLINKKYLSTLNARRIFNSIGCYGQAACLIWLSYISSSQSYMAIVILCLNASISTGIMVGHGISHLDLSPRFSGIIFGFINGTSQCFSIAGPLVAQWLITDESDTSMWRILFMSSAGFYFIGATIFNVFGSATRQPWDGPAPTSDRIKKVSVVSLTEY